ncbi:MAG: ATP-binding protein, partial [Haloechinothrix sp.]
MVSGDAPPEYGDAERFFSRTLITDGLTRFAGEVLRRLAGEREGANAVLNLVTEFGGGKTHALTLLYHLARLGPEAGELPGVGELMEAARLDDVPGAVVAVFVGTEWDAVAGKGGDGEPHRRTPWGDIAWQLGEQVGDPSLFEHVAEQDEARIRPGKDRIRRLLPGDRPVLILMDEVMNFMTAARGIRIEETTLASQFYEFLHNLTDEADARDRLAVVVSLPKSEEEMSSDDWGDFRRLSKVTTRVAEPYVLAKDLEIPEIVRRRLFDTPGTEGEVRETAKAFARWLDDHRDLVPGWFPVDRAEEHFRATYPFHPTVLSVFQRKWQSLSSFQRTRGILRLLAQWVSIAYGEGYTGAHEDLLVGIGTAPLDDQLFREAALQQLGSEELKAAIITDIAGDESFSESLDAEAPETLRQARVHRKVATAIFFESSGGQVRERATLPEVRLAVGEPGLDLGNVETALDALRDSCYYLAVEGGEYRFSTKPNLNRLLADRRAALDAGDVEERARTEVRRVFAERRGVEKPFDVTFFPEDPATITDTPTLRLLVLGPERSRGEETRGFIERCMAEHGASPRRFVNGLVWVVPESPGQLLDVARRHLAWESLETEGRDLDEEQRVQITEQKARAKLDLTEAVWRTYRWLAFLGSDGETREEDLGLVHSSAAESMQALIQARLRQHDELTETLAPPRVVRNWPGGRTEWSTKELRDSVYASPAFTRLADPEALRQTIGRGVSEGQFGYAVKGEAGYIRVVFGEPLDATDVEFSEDSVLLLPETARVIREAEPSP